MTNIQRKSLNVVMLALHVLCSAAIANAQTIYALSTEKLLGFEAANPGMLTTNVSITGVVAGHQLMGIDFRPATGQLYALGYNSVSGAGELYTIDRNTGVATPLGAPALNFGAGITDLGFDFNPTVDRIRITGSNGANYRVHPVTGALVATDGTLAFAAGDANAGTAPNIGTVGYTNSYIGATSTTLYNYDFALNVFTTQIPPNNGTLNTVGSSGLSLNAIDPSADLDIWFDPVARVNRAYFAASTATVNDDLYTVDLTTGAVTLVGPIGAGFPVRDIAVLIERNVPATTTGDLLYALSATGNLIAFDAAQPDIVRAIVPVSGLATGQALSGLDFRPATGELYALGYNAMNGEARLYTINLNTGAATAIGAAPVVLAPALGKIGFDFNPTVDRIRLTGSNNANYRLHPVTGAIAATDMSLAFAAGDVNAGANPSVGTVGYTNSFNGATATTLYNYDDSLNVFTSQIPPNNGTLNTVGASGIAVNLADPSSDLDIFYDGTTQQNRAYFAANKGASANDDLYSVNLATGQATVIGSIGLGIAITDIAAFIRSTVGLVCPANVVVTSDPGASSAVATYTIPTSTSTCPAGGATVSLVSGPASGSSFPAGTTTVTYSAGDACGNAATCSFTVTVLEGACDVKTLGCIRYELLNIRRNADGDESYRIRVTNNCTSALSYVAFQVPDGVTPTNPANNATYTGGSGNAYTVRNPNFSPFYSVRFKSQGAGIANGQSDIFEYALPAQSDVLFLYAFARFADGSSLAAHLNTFGCDVQPFNNASRPDEDLAGERSGETASALRVYPNPTAGAFYADLSSWAGQRVTLSVLNATGQAVMVRQMEGGDQTSLQLPSGLANGLYYLRITAADGASTAQRFVVQK